ncbi:MAG: Wzz/FepE/Etk N-terminal domain-containing protein [Nitrospirota bacterium]
MRGKEEVNDETNLLEYIDIMVSHRILIIITVVVAVAAAAVISILTPKTYEARAVIMPVAQMQDQNGMNAVALQLGITARQTSNASELFSLLHSNILMERVVTKNSLVPVLLGKAAAGKNENEQLWDSIRYLKNTIYKATDNRRDGTIELSVQFRDPQMSTMILTSILTELTDYMSSEAKRVADTNKQYLESLIDKNSDPLIKQKIYALIARQIEISMMAEVKENFAFKVLDPPRIPDKSVRPRILINIMLSFITSLLVGICLAFIVEHIKAIRESRQNHGK